MRPIFASPRLENVDRVVALLRIAGIEPIVNNRKPWAEGWDRRHNPYSERQTKEHWPQVCVLPSDLIKARQILRDANVVATPRVSDLNYIPSEPSIPARRGVSQLRLWLLGICTLGAALLALQFMGAF